MNVNPVDPGPVMYTPSGKKALNTPPEKAVKLDYTLNIDGKTYAIFEFDSDGERYNVDLSKYPDFNLTRTYSNGKKEVFYQKSDGTKIPVTINTVDKSNAIIPGYIVEPISLTKGPQKPESKVTNQAPEDLSRMVIIPSSYIRLKSDGEQSEPEMDVIHLANLNPVRINPEDLLGPKIPAQSQPLELKRMPENLKQMRLEIKPPEPEPELEMDAIPLELKGMEKKE